MWKKWYHVEAMKWKKNRTIIGLTQKLRTQDAYILIICNNISAIYPMTMTKLFFDSEKTHLLILKIFEDDV